MRDTAIRQNALPPSAFRRSHARRNLSTKRHILGTTTDTSIDSERRASTEESSSETKSQHAKADPNNPQNHNVVNDVDDIESSGSEIEELERECRAELGLETDRDPLAGASDNMSKVDKLMHAKILENTVSRPSYDKCNLVEICSSIRENRPLLRRQMRHVAFRGFLSQNIDEKYNTSERTETVTNCPNTSDSISTSGNSGPGDVYNNTKFTDAGALTTPKDTLGSNMQCTSVCSVFNTLCEISSDRYSNIEINLIALVWGLQVS